MPSMHKEIIGQVVKQLSPITYLIKTVKQKQLFLKIHLQVPTNLEMKKYYKFTGELSDTKMLEVNVLEPLKTLLGYLKVIIYQKGNWGVATFTSEKDHHLYLTITGSVTKMQPAKLYEITGHFKQTPKGKTFETVKIALVENQK